MSESMPAPRFSVAPMLDWTNRYYRFLARLLSPSSLLYTEMVPLGAIIHGNAEQHMAYAAMEHPIALQIGGSDPQLLGQAARQAASLGFDEINLNVGCPSDRVAAGGFGISLYREPAKVAQCVAEMVSNTSVPITVKTRIGLDDLDSFDYLCTFIEQLLSAGMSRLIVHARMAYPSKYSPRQNRSIPSLQYDVVYRLKRCFQTTPIVINGNIHSVEATLLHLKQVDGVMAGRWVYTNPLDLVAVERALYHAEHSVDVMAVLAAYLDEIEPDWQVASPSVLLRPLQGIFRGEPGSRGWRCDLAALHDAKGRQLPFATIRRRISSAAHKMILSSQCPLSERDQSDESRSLS